MRFENVLGICAELRASRAELQVAAVARAVDSALRSGAPPLSVATAYLVVGRALVEVLGPLERLTRELARAPAGAVQRIE